MCRTSLLEALQVLPCASAKRKVRPVNPQIATALRGASLSHAAHWAGAARITRQPTSHHSRQNRRDERERAVLARCTFFFVLQLPFRNRCQYRHPSTVGQIAGLSTLQRRPQTRHGRGSKPPASHSALEEPVIGCGCEISARSWPCNTLQRAWRRSGCPKTVSVAPALKHGLGCR
jgi:hypothetical protein